MKSIDDLKNRINNLPVDNRVEPYKSLVMLYAVADEHDHVMRFFQKEVLPITSMLRKYFNDLAFQYVDYLIETNNIKQVELFVKGIDDYSISTDLRIWLISYYVFNGYSDIEEKVNYFIAPIFSFVMNTEAYKKLCKFIMSLGLYGVMYNIAKNIVFKIPEALTLYVHYLGFYSALSFDETIYHSNIKTIETVGKEFYVNGILEAILYFTGLCKFSIAQEIITMFLEDEALIKQESEKIVEYKKEYLVKVESCIYSEFVNVSLAFLNNLVKFAKTPPLEAFEYEKYKEQQLTNIAKDFISVVGNCPTSNIKIDWDGWFYDILPYLVEISEIKYFEMFYSRCKNTKTLQDILANAFVCFGGLYYNGDNND